MMNSAQSRVSRKTRRRRIIGAHVRCYPESGTRARPLQDPCGDRYDVCPAPPQEVLTGESFWRDSGPPDVDALVKHLALEGFVSQELLLEIVQKASEVLEREPNLLRLSDPCVVVGDLHGQFYDCLRVLEVGGSPRQTQYLFLGDYVDRGSMSVEIVIALFAWKIAYPKNVWLLRGNHECRHLTNSHNGFGFGQEVDTKYDSSVFNAIMEAFDTLPLAATINGRFLCVHGGISPELTNVCEINKLDRFQETLKDGLMCDLLWSDPTDGLAGRESKAGDAVPFAYNTVRNCSCVFSIGAASTFLERNGIFTVIRAHEVMMDGFRIHGQSPNTGFPTVITVFSAANYCESYGNQGALLKIANNTLNVVQYETADAPFRLPQCMDIFTWSLPFVIEKIVSMMLQVLLVGAGSLYEADLPEDLTKVLDHEQVNSSAMTWRNSLSSEQNQVLHVARMCLRLSPAAAAGIDEIAASDEESRLRMRKTATEFTAIQKRLKSVCIQHEAVLELNGACPGFGVDAKKLVEGKKRSKSLADLFRYAKHIDAANERRPDVEGAEDSDEDPDEDEQDAAVDEASSPASATSPPSLATSKSLPWASRSPTT